MTFRLLSKNEALQLKKILPKILHGTNHIENPKYSLSSSVRLSLSLFLIIFALLRPQWGFEMIEGTHEGIDLVIGVDVSDSMLAEDAKPDRLSFARRKIDDLIDITRGDRLALISFAGASFIESPLTLDYGSIKLTSQNLSTDLVPVKGSNFESAAVSTANLFEREDKKHNLRARALIVFTDGEFEENTFLAGLEVLKKANVIPFLIVIGAEEGAPIPTASGFKRDKSNKIILSKAPMSKLNEDLVKFGGLAIRATLNDKDITEIYSAHIKNALEQKKISYTSVKKWNEYFQIPLFLGVLALLWTWKFSIFRHKHTLILALLSIWTSNYEAYAQDSSKLLKAQQLYENGKFQDALSLLNEETSQSEDSFNSHLLSGNSYYRLGDFNKALDEYGKAQSLAKDPKERAKALFNSADSLTQLGQFQKSLDALKQAEKETPKDKEINNNIEYVKKLLKDLSEKKKEESQNKEEQKQEQNQQSGAPDDTGDKGTKKEDQKSDSGQSSENNDSQNRMDENNQENDKTKEGKKNEPQRDNESSPKKESEKSEENLDQSNDSPKEKGTGSKPNNKNTSLDQTDQLESQLESLEENTSARNQYRHKKALEQVERSQKQPSAMDW